MLVKIEQEGGVKSIKIAEASDGLNAYQVAVKNGFVGTEADWEASLQASVTSDSIATALGYTPADAIIQTEISANTTDRHTHANKTIIDKFGEDVNGDPTYNGTKVDTTIAQRDVYDGLDSINNTVSLSANNGKILKDAQDAIAIRTTSIETSLGDIDAALDTINGQII